MLIARVPLSPLMMTVVGEGVETVGQRRELRRRGC